MISLLVILLGQFIELPTEPVPGVHIYYAGSITIVKPPCRPTVRQFGTFVGCMNGPVMNTNSPCVTGRWRPVYMIAPTDPVSDCDEWTFDQIHLLTFICRSLDTDADGDVDMRDFSRLQRRRTG
ncbi:hypothetical protein LCGC14_1129800 [marine sediment metagenome]|uniref:EF-hand domain-containing protein n=1 Tax=marine sediment metagenome TaxID=412755 RepID=A0A0F9PJM2_9ZZZZ